MKKFIVNSLAVIGGLTVVGTIAGMMITKKAIKGINETMTQEGLGDLSQVIKKASEDHKMNEELNRHAEKYEIKIAKSDNGSITFIKDGEIRDEDDSLEQAYNYVTEHEEINK